MAKKKQSNRVRVTFQMSNGQQIVMEDIKYIPQTLKDQLPYWQLDEGPHGFLLLDNQFMDPLMESYTFTVDPPIPDDPDPSRAIRAEDDRILYVIQKENGFRVPVRQRLYFDVYAESSETSEWPVVRTWNDMTWDQSLNIQSVKVERV